VTLSSVVGVRVREVARPNGMSTARTQEEPLMAVIVTTGLYNHPYFIISASCLCVKTKLEIGWMIQQSCLLALLINGSFAFLTNQRAWFQRSQP